jgi:hypothetical protein
MLWYKWWRDTRWALLIGLALMIAMSAALVLGEYESAKWLTRLQRRFGGALPEAMAMLNSYPGYIWARLFRDNLLDVWSVWAIMMGSIFTARDGYAGISGLTPQFTLSLPVTRRRLLAMAAATGVLELAVLSIGPFLLIPLLSSLIGQSYRVKDAVIYALLMAVGGLVLFSFSFLLTTILNNTWLANGIGLVVYFTLFSRAGIAESPGWNIVYRTMSGQSYFLNGQIPWGGLCLSMGLAVGIFYLSVRIFERRDF